MNIIQDSGKELAITSAATIISAALGVWWIFLIGIMFSVVLWAVNAKQRQQKRLDRLVKKERVKDRIRRYKRAKIFAYENPPNSITDPSRLLSS